MKNILFICDNFLYGGMESRIIDEVKFYKEQNINVYLACQKCSEKYQEHFKDILELNSLPQSVINKKNILENRDKLSSFCKKHAIDFIDCQPFWCIVPATLAAEKDKLPISYTLHGISSGDFVPTSLPELSTLIYLILRYGFDKIFSVAEYLSSMYSFISPNIDIARNGTSFEHIIHFYPREKHGRVAIASRLDGIKTPLVIDFLKFIENTPSIQCVDIYGDGDAKGLLEDYVKNTKTQQKVTVCGWEENLISKLIEQQYNAAFGMGRVILDIIKSGTPAGIIGYGGFIDFITKENLQDFAKTNLTSWESFSDNNFASLFNKVQNHPDKYIFKESELVIFDNKVNWKNYYKLLQKTSFYEKPIISQLNKLLDNSDTQNIFTILDSYKDLDLDIPYKFLKAYYLTQEHENLIRKENIALHKELDDITNSNFWKTTEPIRHFLQKVRKK